MLAFLSTLCESFIMILADIKEGSSYLLGFLGVFSEGDLFFIFL